MKSLLKKLDRAQRERTWLALPFAVLKKFSEDQAGSLAALISYYAFFSIFPLLMVLVTVLGFVLQGNPTLEHKVFTSALGQFPIIGNEAIGKQIHPLKGNLLALIVGVLLGLWSGLGVAKTAQNGFNTVYAVPMTDRPNFVKSTLRSVVLILIVGGGLIITTLLSGVVTGAGSYGLNLGIGLRIAGAIIAIALNTAVFTCAFNWLTVREMTWRDALPGGVIAAVAWYILELVGTALIAHKLKGAQSTYGTFATVIGLLTWFYLISQIVLLAAEINVVKQFRLWPRALADAPDTDADFRSYEGYAEREIRKDDQDVDTQFGKNTEREGFDREPASERRR